MLFPKLLIAFVCVCLVKDNLVAQQTYTSIPSPDGRYELFLNEKDLDNNSRYFESFVIDRSNGEKIVLAKNYKTDTSSPVWYWDKNSKYLIFEGNEYSSIPKIQFWDLENKFLRYELKGELNFKADQTETDWDAEKELLTFQDGGTQKKLDIKTRKVHTDSEDLVIKE